MAEGEENKVKSSCGAEVGSVWESFEDIKTSIQGKLPVFFLDYDGTLSPIVDTPDEAYMSTEMREAVKKLTFHFPCAIVSGRAKQKVKNFVKLDSIFYAGSHGLDISGPDYYPINTNVSTSIETQLMELEEELNDALNHIDGAWVENNRFALSVHYRHVELSKVGEVQKVVESVLVARGTNNEIRISHGKKVLELKPNNRWHKGAAVLWILEKLNLDNNPDIVPFFIGDDTTDEDAFVTLRKLGKGVPILVCDKPESRYTAASYRLTDPEDVKEFLSRVADLQHLANTEYFQTTVFKNRKYVK